MGTQVLCWFPVAVQVLVLRADPDSEQAVRARGLAGCSVTNRPFLSQAEPGQVSQRPEPASRLAASPVGRPRDLAEPAAYPTRRSTISAAAGTTIAATGSNAHRLSSVAAGAPACLAALERRPSSAAIS